MDTARASAAELPVTITVAGDSVPPVADPPENFTPSSTQERNEFAASGPESHAGLAVTGLAAGILDRFDATSAQGLDTQKIPPEPTTNGEPGGFLSENELGYILDHAPTY